MPDLTTDVRYVKGIGEQRAKGLEKLGIRTLRDLISYFPRAYDDRRAYKKIKDLVDGPINRTGRTPVWRPWPPPRPL